MSRCLVFSPRKFALHGATICGTVSGGADSGRVAGPAECRSQRASPPAVPAQTSRPAGDRWRVRVLFPGRGATAGTTVAARGSACGLGDRGVGSGSGAVAGGEVGHHFVLQLIGRAATAPLCRVGGPQSRLWWRPQDRGVSGGRCPHGGSRTPGIAGRTSARAANSSPGRGAQASRKKSPQ